MGREHRLVTLAQRGALAARDGGCVVPGCGAPPDWCDAHHVVHRADGGRSDLANYALLCPGHHTAVHAGTWQVSVVRGRVVITPPRWVDPTRTPRAARHRAVEQVLSDLDGLIRADRRHELGDDSGSGPLGLPHDHVDDLLGGLPPPGRRAVADDAVQRLLIAELLRPARFESRGADAYVPP